LLDGGCTSAPRAHWILAADQGHEKLCRFALSAALVPSPGSDLNLPLRACEVAMANVGAGLPQSTSRVRLLHEACRRNYWLPPVRQCPIVPPKYEKIASAFAGLVLRATNWNARRRRSPMSRYAPTLIGMSAGRLRQPLARTPSPCGVVRPRMDHTLCGAAENFEDCAPLWIAYSSPPFALRLGSAKSQTFSTPSSRRI
jgi:hypothetical protein